MTGIDVTQLNPDLRAYWYPITLSEKLTNDPFGTHILGDPIVLFRSNQKAVCLADICAHRSAPLSVGRVENNCLECPYHGWQYDSSGRVVHIPALLPESKIPANAKIRVYPCVEKQGLVWIWPGPVESADEDKIPVEDTLDYLISTQVDIPIDHCLMVENLLDPAHVPFTHEGTIGKRQEARPIRMNATMTQKSLQGSMSGGPRSAQSTFDFIPPCTVLMDVVMNKRGWILRMYSYCIPLEPNYMRLIVRSYRNWLPFLNWPGFKQMFHKQNLSIVYQDYEVLQGQVERLQTGAKPWNSPIQVDNLPHYYRFWLEHCLKKKPYFRGWDNGLEIEDLVKIRSQCKEREIQGRPERMKYYKVKPSLKKTPWTKWLFTLTVAALSIGIGLYVSSK